MDFTEWTKKLRNAYTMCGSHSGRGYMRWWHSFLAVSVETGEQRAFFVEYFIRRSSHLAVKAGVFPTDTSPGRQFHVLFPIDSVKSAKEPLILQAGDCFYSDNHIAGRAKNIEWNLNVHKSTSCAEHFWNGPVAYFLRLLEGYWQGDGIRTLYQGQIILDDIVYEVTPEICLGYSDKHWGRHASRPILQLNANRLISGRTGRELKHSALAVHDCLPKFLCFPLKRRLMIHLTYMGEQFDFGMPQPGTLSRCRLRKKETNRRYIWHILGQQKTAVVKLTYSSHKDQMMNLNQKYPLLAGANGAGILELYRMTPEGRVLLDTLSFDSGFWAFREDFQ